MINEKVGEGKVILCCSVCKYDYAVELGKTPNEKETSEEQQEMFWLQHAKCVEQTEMIPKSHAALYVDITCCRCGKLVALSNTQQYVNCRYCNTCIEIRNEHDMKDMCLEGGFG